MSLPSRTSSPEPNYAIDESFAAQMGFSNFGFQQPGPSKKRRYNPSADAMTSVSIAADSSRHRASGSRGSSRGRATTGSGSNKVVLGYDRMRGGREQASRIVNGVVGSTHGAPGEKDEMTSSANMETEVEADGQDGDGNEEPHYVDGTPSPPRTLDIGGEKMMPRNAELDFSSITSDENINMDSRDHFDEHATQIALAASRTSREGTHEYDWNALRRGVRNHRGDIAYYDRSFVEDPWRELSHSK